MLRPLLACLCLACVVLGGCGFMDQDILLSDEAYAESFGAEEGIMELDELHISGRYRARFGCGGGGYSRSGFNPRPRAKVSEQEAARLALLGRLAGAKLRGGAGSAAQRQDEPDAPAQTRDQARLWEHVNGGRSRIVTQTLSGEL